MFRGFSFCLNHNELHALPVKSPPFAHYLHKQVCNALSRLHDSVALLMDIAVHRDLDISVSRNGLQRLDIRHNGLRVGQEAVPEYMGRCTIGVYEKLADLAIPRQLWYHEKYFMKGDDAAYGT